MKFNFSGSGEFKDDQLSLEFEVDVLDQTPPEPPEPELPEPELPEPVHKWSPLTGDFITAPAWQRSLEAPSIVYRRSEMRLYGRLWSADKGGVLGYNDVVVASQKISDPRHFVVFTDNHSNVYVSAITYENNKYVATYYLLDVSATSVVSEHSRPDVFTPPAPGFSDVHALGLDYDNKPSRSWWKYDDFSNNDYKRSWVTNDNKRCSFMMPALNPGIVRWESYGFSVRQRPDGSWTGLIGLLGVIDPKSQSGNLLPFTVESPNGVDWAVGEPLDLTGTPAEGFDPVMVLPNGCPRKWGDDSYLYSLGLMFCSHGTWKYASDKRTGGFIMQEQL